MAKQRKSSYEYPDTVHKKAALFRNYGLLAVVGLLCLLLPALSGADLVITFVALTLTFGIVTLEIIRVHRTPVRNNKRSTS